MKALLYTLLFFAGITATVSGLLIINNPDGEIMNLSLSLLAKTPFNDFLVPGIVLILLVGGINLHALFYNILSNESRYEWSIAGGIMTCGFILAQLILIRAFSWLQVLYIAVGLGTILIAHHLKNEWEQDSRDTPIF